MDLSETILPRMEAKKTTTKMNIPKEVKHRPEMKNHPLAMAAREVNDYCETHSMEETCEHYGLKLADLQYIADQRALRAMCAFYGRNFKKQGEGFDTMQLSATELAEHIKWTTIYMDALMIGWRARTIAANDWLDLQIGREPADG